jgi:hypothetical protein
LPPQRSRGVAPCAAPPPVAPEAPNHAVVVELSRVNLSLLWSLNLPLRNCPLVVVVANPRTHSCGRKRGVDNPRAPVARKMKTPLKKISGVGSPRRGKADPRQGEADPRADRPIHFGESRPRSAQARYRGHLLGCLGRMCHLLSRQRPLGTTALRQFLHIEGQAVPRGVLLGGIHEPPGCACDG